MNRKTSILLAVVALICAVTAHADQWGLIKIPVSCMRTGPSHAAEQSTQAIMGTPLRILAKKGDWYKIEMPDGYTGYMRSNTICPLNEVEYKQWLQSPRVVCKTWLTRLEDKEGPDGYAPYGAILVRNDADMEKPGYVSVITPTGKQLFVNEADIWTDTRDWVDSCSRGGVDEVLNLAYTMLGAPYLWGGTSTLAPDCSGFTQISYTAAGLLLPRDTSMQIKCGEKVPSMKEAQRGDLIFYGDNGRVNHVAIYLGNGKIIHSSGRVRICRMNKNVPGDEDLFTATPMAIRRCIGIANPQGVKPLAGNPWYFTNSNS